MRQHLLSVYRPDISVMISPVTSRIGGGCTITNSLESATNYRRKNISATHGVYPPFMLEASNHLSPISNHRLAISMYTTTLFRILLFYFTIKTYAAQSGAF